MDKFNPDGNLTAEILAIQDPKSDNCGSCHIHGEGARIPSYLGFKIAKNPLKEVLPEGNYRKEYDFALVRRTLAAPDNWKEYGVPEYANFDTFPIYNYTTPHNILRWTSRTEVESGKSCGSSCHIREDGGQIINKELYLFESDLEFDWEKSSSTFMTVDGELPSGWPVK
jgi:hypothetical protein